MTLFEKVTAENIKATYKKLGYPFFTKGDYNLNLGIVRSVNRVSNSFDDVMYCICNVGGTPFIKKCMATADPGEYYLKNPMDPGGAAIVVEGFYRGLYKVGIFHNRPALLQVKPIKVYRDKNRDNILDLDHNTITEGNYGILCHESFQIIETPLNVGNSSAACFVCQKTKDHLQIMWLCQKAVEIWGNSLSWCVLDENQILV